MDPGQPDHKRPRLDTGNNHPWTSSLPQPTPSQQPQPGGPGPYSHQHQQYPPRTAEPLSRSLPPPQQSAPPPPPPPPPYANDRRHHEQDPYTPIQDHYRQPHSPARAPSNNYAFPPRDPGIKREMYDDSAVAPRRPHSTGGAPDSHPAAHSPHPSSHPPQPLPNHAPPGPPHPPPPQQQQQYQDDSRRHMSYDTPPTPVAYRNSYPPPPPPPPIAQQSPYEQPAYHPPPSGSDSVYGSHVSYAATQKRKATRASQACDNCRQLKAKCDETRPCKTCREKNVECKYRDPIPKPTDKTQTDILEGIADLKSLLSARFDSVEKRIERLEGGAPPPSRIKLEHERESMEHGASPAPVTEAAYDTSELHRGSQGPPTVYGTPQGVYTPADMVEDPPHAHAHDPDAMDDAHLPHTVIEDERDDDHVDGPPGRARPPGQPAIPVNHTTSAGLLLKWDTIRLLTHDLLGKENIRYAEDFPLMFEERRGPLRLYGRGEGHGRSSGLQSEHGVLDVDLESISEPGSSPAGQADWGQLGSLSPGVDYTSSNLTPHGMPDFSEAKVREYIQSFQDNILSLHPIFPPRHLKVWVRNLLDQTAVKKSRGQKLSGVARFAEEQASQLAHGESSGGKRKRSPTGGSDSYERAATSPGAKPGKPYRTVDNALVFAALALGKLSLHKGKVPDVTPSEDRSHNSPVVKNGHPASPAHASPPSHPQSQASSLHSPREHNTNSTSRRTSLQGTSAAGQQKHAQSMKRNYDAIPGLEYLGLATDILGNQNGSSLLRQVQANIFVGLYYGQLGYVVPSLKYIVDAAWTVQILMRRHLPRLQAMGGPPQKKLDHLLLTAFWTCLQLESDIVVELALPRSGILSYEDGLPYPNLFLFEGDDRISASYCAQVYLRKQLNLVSAKFYDENPSPRPNDHEGPQTVAEVRETIRMDPTAQVTWIPSMFRFSIDDPPATDMLAARLRAKYWGFQVITLRPFVKMMLDFTMRRNDSVPTDAAMFAETQFNKNVQAPHIEAGTTSHDQVPSEIVVYAREGIRALFESTTAFHGLGDNRLILTNFFGTAMAQWGNLLVLAACYQDGYLHQFVHADRLLALFNKTIAWINLGTQPSSSLAMAIRLLEGVRERIFPADGSRTFSTDVTGIIINGVPLVGQVMGGPPISGHTNSVHNSVQNSPVPSQNQHASPQVTGEEVPAQSRQIPFQQPQQLQQLPQMRM
ncbi:hypothetical protein ACHAQA_001957 [Verticillium albo-atrum]